MADIFSTSVPDWLQNIAKPADMGIASKVIGEVVGGGMLAAKMVGKERAEAEAAGKEKPGWLSTWYHDLPKGIAEARLNLLDPTLRLKVAEQGLHVQAMRTALQAKQQQMNDTAQDQQQLPQWMSEHPTWESRQSAEWPTARTPQGEKMLNDLRLRDSQSVQAKVTIQGVQEFSKRVDALSKADPVAAAQITGLMRPGQVPSPEAVQALNFAEQTAQQRLANERERVEQEAIKRSDVVETRITEKGVEKRFKPSVNGTGKEVSPKEMTLSDGTKIVYNPKGGGFKVLTPKGESKDMTPAQLLGIANHLDLFAGEDTVAKENAKKIMDFLSGKAVQQVTPKDQAVTPKLGESKEAPAKPTTKSEFDKLPKGAFFINPADGKLKQKQ